MKKILLIMMISSSLFGFIRIPIYSDYVDKAYAETAKLHIRHILNEVKLYYIEEGEVPNSVDDMLNMGFLHFGESAMKEWFFYLELDYDEGLGIVGHISAESTDEMAGGVGNLIILDIETEQFCGYGQKLECSD